MVGWGEERKMAFGEGRSGANPGPTTQHLVGQGPCALPGVRYGIGGRTGASGPTDDKEICASPVRADVGIGPYENATRGAMGGRPQGSPLRKSYKGCGEVRNPPVGFAVTAPLPKGGRGDGGYGCPCCGAQNFCAALRRTLEILTAATRSPRFFCHWQRSARSPQPVCELVSQ